MVGVEATGINACPCAQGLVRNRASERLLDEGFDAGDVERILELVPIATHNQRGRQTLFVGTEQDLDAEVLVDIAERSMSAPIYDLLKRPDELFVVEHAHLQPRFVEDSVRHALRDALATLPQLDDDDFLLSKQVNFETIHVHDVVAERFGTVGELRSELATGEPSAAQTTLAAWLSHWRQLRAARTPQLEAVLGAGEQPADVLVVQRDHGDRAGDPEGDDRPRVAERDDEDRERDAPSRSSRRTRTASPRRRASQRGRSTRRRAARARTSHRLRSPPSSRPSRSGGRPGAHGRSSRPPPRARR